VRAVRGGLLGYLTGGRRAWWRAPVTAVACGGVVLGVMAPMPASAVVVSSTVGQITSVVDDPDVWGEDGPVGGPARAWMGD